MSLSLRGVDQENERAGRWLRGLPSLAMIRSGGNPAVMTERQSMQLSDLCLILGVLFAFATLVVKIIEVSRTR